MMKSIATAAMKAVGRRTGAPIHRNSKPAGKCETMFWRRTSRRDVRQIVLAARRYEVANKAPGCRNGPLGAVAIEILDLLANMVDFKTGRLDPSLDTLMSRLRRSRDAIVRGLAALRQHGFVDWLRRFVPVEGAEGEKGPQVKQTSNAYRLVMPKRAQEALGRYGAPAPLPEDEEQRIEERKAEAADFDDLRNLSMEEVAALIRSPDPADQARARLSILLKQRESAKQTETRSLFNYISEE